MNRVGRSGTNIWTTGTQTWWVGLGQQGHRISGENLDKDLDNRETDLVEKDSDSDFDNRVMNWWTGFWLRLRQQGLRLSGVDSLSDSDNRDTDSVGRLWTLTTGTWTWWGGPKLGY